MKTYKIGDVLRPVSRRRSITPDIVIIVGPSKCSARWRMLGIRADGYFTGIYVTETKTISTEYIRVGHCDIEGVVESARKVKEFFNKEE